MALTIEDGSIVAGANSYITVAEYTAWANARFGSARSTLPADEGAYEAVILRAMDYFELQIFKGRTVEEDQPLQFPRSYLVIDRYSVESNEIPKEVKASLYELAYAEEKGLGQLNDVDRTVSKEKIGPLEVEYSDSSASRTLTPPVSAAMSKLVAGGSYGANFMVGRG